MSPKPVNDLGAGFHSNFLAIWQDVSIRHRVVRPYPSLLSIDTNLLFLVHNVVVNDTGYFKLVSFSTIGVQHDLSIFQTFVGNGQSFTTTDWTRAR